MTKEEYSQRRAELKDQIAKLTADLNTLDNEYALMISNFKIGDIIEYGHKNRFRGVVKGVRLEFGHNLLYKVSRIKKDGTVSDAITDVYSYHKPQKIEL